MTTGEFISKAKRNHSDNLDYSQTEYINARTKVTINCLIHGPFQQLPSDHLKGRGCPKCGYESQWNKKRENGYKAITQVTNTTSFIIKAKEIHGDKYDYTKSLYVKSQQPICIICPQHGEFWQTPNNHISGQGCPMCGRENQTSKRNGGLDAFIVAAKKKHGTRYDYQKAQYINATTKICIICPEHGEFWQTPSKHLNCEVACPVCANKLVNTDIFIDKAKLIHGDNYDYSKVEYVDARSKVCIVCPEHGEFWQSPHGHLSGKQCPKCVGGIGYSQAQFIEMAKEKHSNKYDYSKVNYINSTTKVCIICPEHGEFWQSPSSHLSGAQCLKCSGYFMDSEYFIERAKNIHGNKYDYSKVEYVDAHSKVCIICPEHGEFWQSATSHLSGQGCPACNNSHLENDVEAFLTNHSIEFVRQKTFSWLVFQGKMRLDYYLPKYKVAIECQGGQHFKSVNWFGGEANLAVTQFRDKLKKDLCVKHGIKVLYYSNLGIDYPYKVYENFSELLQAIVGIASQ